MHTTPNCDLHTHTLHSDGVLTPEALVELAARRGVTSLAVTDHDTMAGLPAAMTRARDLGVEIVPGIELSVHEEGRDVHLLGYFVSRPEVLQEALDEIQVQRRHRGAAMVARLLELGCAIDYADVEARARGGVVGRPHVAEVLVQCGFAGSLNEAFDRWIGNGRPAFVPKRTVSLSEGVQLLRRAGGVPVVAHPGVSDCDELLGQMRDRGVLGLEVFHPAHDEELVRRYSKFAARYGYLMSGGSDFHREAPGAFLPGDLHLPGDMLDALRPHAS